MVYETALSEGVKTMVLQGVGIAWIPMGIIEKELNDGSLMILDELPKIDLKVMLYAHKTSKTQVVADFWQFLAQMNN